MEYDFIHVKIVLYNKLIAYTFLENFYIIQNFHLSLYKFQKMDFFYLFQ